MKNKIIEDCLNEQFPKGKCKERGNALVLNAVANSELKKQRKEILEILGDEYKRVLNAGRDNRIIHYFVSILKIKIRKLK